MLSHDPPVFGCLMERSLGFGVLSVVRQLVALSGQGAKIVCPLHGKPPWTVGSQIQRTALGSKETYP
jgi:hypothetical protein